MLARYFQIILCCFLLIACDSNQAGTRTGNPGNPAPSEPSKVVPDFTVFIPESALGSDDAASEATSAATAKAADAAAIGTSAAAETLDEPASRWTGIFLEGLMQTVREHRQDVIEILEAVAQALTDRDIAEITAETTVTLADQDLIDSDGAWTVTLVPDTIEANSVRVFFQNAAGDYEATYLFQVDEGLETSHGVFAYANPAMLESSASGEDRLFTVSFDFRNAEQYLLSVMGEHYDANQGYYVPYLIHYQCDSVNNKCIGELFIIGTEAPERTFAESTRFFWNTETLRICLTYVNYSGEDIVVETTQSFIGPDQPEASDVTVGGCEMPEPSAWTGYHYAETDLPARDSETTPTGGSATEFFQDVIPPDGENPLEYFTYPNL